ncbi:hypothetical protein PIB30_016838 [Stylosanthes scabra]|uniref:Ubiquitin-like protease family profile domain-containing protein n=1 Tax=Stylosanthes scabra TaxID=79078 RepID=A0ABU6T8M6_9FABA|nr:hypothetical protein [Stylosanthes scabra]
MDKKKKRPHDISTLINHQECMVYLDKDKLFMHRFLFAPVLNSEHWWLYVLDVEQKNFFVIDYKNIESPSPERTTMNQFAHALEEFRKKIVAKLMLSEENAKRVDIIREVNEMRNIKHDAVLRSPFVQISSADLDSR